MMGHIIEWYYNGIAGIEILKPGMKEIRINPYMPHGMNHFVCTYLTPYGEICVKGIRIDGVQQFAWTLPEGIRNITD